MYMKLGKHNSLKIILTYSLTLEYTCIDRKRWETADNLLFSQHSKPLKASPYTYTFYIEEKKAQQMLQAKGTVVRNNDKGIASFSFPGSMFVNSSS